MKKSPVFDEIYRKYLSDVAALAMAERVERLGVGCNRGEISIDFFGKGYQISAEAVKNEKGVRPVHAISVVLCQYLLLCPSHQPPPSSQWVRYHGFADAAPFAGGFTQNAEQLIAKTFSGRLDDLRDAAALLGGMPYQASYSCDLAFRFKALPKIDLLLIFNDRDEDFAAEASILFQGHSKDYLDMECLAILGMLLARWLKSGPDYRQEES